MDIKISSPYSMTAKYLLYSLLLFSPLARGSVQYWQHTVIELFALALLLVMLLEKGLTGKPAFRKTVLDMPILAMAVLCLLSLLLSKAGNDSAEAFRLLLSYAVFFYAIIYSFRTREDVRELVYVICGVGLLLAIIGFLKHAGITLSVWVYDELNYPASFLSGVYGNHNHLAGYLEMVIPLMLILLLTRNRSGLMKFLLVSLVATCALCHILTLSRGGWFSLGVAMVFMTAVLMFHKPFRNKKLLAILFGSSVLVIFFILSGTDVFQRALTMADDETVLGMNGRVLVWKGTLAMIKDFFVVGIGPGSFSTIFPQYQLPGSTARFYQAHNDYLQYLAELGILFIPLLGWLLVVLFAAGFKKLHSSSRQTWGVALGAMTGIVAILAHSAVDFNLHIPANAILFTVLAALVVGGPVKRNGLKMVGESVARDGKVQAH